MPSQPFECVPSVYTNEAGQEVVDYDNPTFSYRGGYSSDMADFQMNASTDEVTFQQAVDPDVVAENSQSEDYFDALSEAFPMDALQAYAAQAWSPQQIEAFNQTIESGDYGAINQALEQLRDEMEQSGFASAIEEQPEQQTQEDQPSADFSDEEVESIERAYPVEELLDYLAENYDQETIQQFDAVVENGSYDQVAEIYAKLFEDYQENQY